MRNIDNIIHQQSYLIKIYNTIDEFQTLLDKDGKPLPSDREGSGVKDIKIYAQVADFNEPDFNKASLIDTLFDVESTPCQTLSPRPDSNGIYNIELDESYKADEYLIRDQEGRPIGHKDFNKPRHGRYNIYPYNFNKYKNGRRYYIWALATDKAGNLELLNPDGEKNSKNIPLITTDTLFDGSKPQFTTNIYLGKELTYDSNFNKHSIILDQDDAPLIANKLIMPGSTYRILAFTINSKVHYLHIAFNSDMFSVVNIDGEDKNLLTIKFNETYLAKKLEDVHVIEVAHASAGVGSIRIKYPDSDSSNLKGYMIERLSLNELRMVDDINTEEYEHLVGIIKEDHYTDFGLTFKKENLIQPKYQRYLYRITPVSRYAKSIDNIANKKDYIKGFSTFVYDINNEALYFPAKGVAPQKITLDNPTIEEYYDNSSDEAEIKLRWFKPSVQTEASLDVNQDIKSYEIQRNTCISRRSGDWTDGMWETLHNVNKDDYLQEKDENNSIIYERMLWDRNLYSYNSNGEPDTSSENYVLTKYKYRIRAIDYTGNAGEWSYWRGGEAIEATDIQGPDKSKFELKVIGKIGLWAIEFRDRSTDPNIPNGSKKVSDTTQILVHRQRTDGGGTVIGEEKPMPITVVDKFGVAHLLDNDPDTGDVWYAKFKVKGMDKNGNWSDWSNWTNIIPSKTLETAKDMFAPKPPTLVTAAFNDTEPHNPHVKIQWKLPKEEDVKLNLNLIKTEDLTITTDAPFLISNRYIGKYIKVIDNNAARYGYILQHTSTIFTIKEWKNESGTVISSIPATINTFDIVGRDLNTDGNIYDLDGCKIFKRNIEAAGYEDIVPWQFVADTNSKSINIYEDRMFMTGKWIYGVSVYDLSGNESDIAEANISQTPQEVEIEDNIAPGNPEIQSVVGGVGSITLVLKENVAPDIKKYRIYIRDREGKSVLNDKGFYISPEKRNVTEGDIEDDRCKESFNTNTVLFNVSEDPKEIAKYEIKAYAIDGSNNTTDFSADPSKGWRKICTVFDQDGIPIKDKYSFEGVFHNYQHEIIPKEDARKETQYYCRVDLSSYMAASGLPPSPIPDPDENKKEYVEVVEPMDGKVIVRIGTGNNKIHSYTKYIILDRKTKRYGEDEYGPWVRVGSQSVSPLSESIESGVTFHEQDLGNVIISYRVISVSQEGMIRIEYPASMQDKAVSDTTGPSLSFEVKAVGQPGKVLVYWADVMDRYGAKYDLFRTPFTEYEEGTVWSYNNFYKPNDTKVNEKWEGITSVASTPIAKFSTENETQTDIIQIQDNSWNQWGFIPKNKTSLKEEYKNSYKGRAIYAVVPCDRWGNRGTPIFSNTVNIPKNDYATSVSINASSFIYFKFDTEEKKYKAEPYTEKISITPNITSVEYLETPMLKWYIATDINTFPTNPIAETSLSEGIEINPNDYANHNQIRIRVELYAEEMTEAIDFDEHLIQCLGNGSLELRMIITNPVHTVVTEDDGTNGQYSTAYTYASLYYKGENVTVFKKADGTPNYQVSFTNPSLTEEDVEYTVEEDTDRKRLKIKVNNMHVNQVEFNIYIGFESAGVLADAALTTGQFQVYKSMAGQRAIDLIINPTDLTIQKYQDGTNSTDTCTINTRVRKGQIYLNASEYEIIHEDKEGGGIADVSIDNDTKNVTLSGFSTTVNDGNLNFKAIVGSVETPPTEFSWRRIVNAIDSKSIMLSSTAILSFDSLGKYNGTEDPKMDITPQNFIPSRYEIRYIFDTTASGQPAPFVHAITEEEIAAGFSTIDLQFPQIQATLVKKAIVVEVKGFDDKNVHVATATNQFEMVKEGQGYVVSLSKDSIAVSCDEFGRVIEGQLSNAYSELTVMNGNEKLSPVSSIEEVGKGKFYAELKPTDASIEQILQDKSIKIKVTNMTEGIDVSRVDITCHCESINEDFQRNKTLHLYKSIPLRGENAVIYYIKPINGTALHNSKGTLKLEAWKNDGKSAYRVTDEEEVKLWWVENGIWVSPSLGSGTEKEFGDKDIKQTLIVYLKDKDNNTKDSITLIDVTDGEVFSGHVSLSSAVIKKNKEWRVAGGYAERYDPENIYIEPHLFFNYQELSKIEGEIGNINSVNVGVGWGSSPQLKDQIRNMSPTPNIDEITLQDGDNEKSHSIKIDTSKMPSNRKEYRFVYDYFYKTPRGKLLYFYKNIVIHVVEEGSSAVHYRIDTPDGNVFKTNPNTGETIPKTLRVRAYMNRGGVDRPIEDSEIGIYYRNKDGNLERLLSDTEMTPNMVNKKTTVYILAKRQPSGYFPNSPDLENFKVLASTDITDLTDGIDSHNLMMGIEADSLAIQGKRDGNNNYIFSPETIDLKGHVYFDGIPFGGDPDDLTCTVTSNVSSGVMIDSSELPAVTINPSELYRSGETSVTIKMSAKYENENNSKTYHAFASETISLIVEPPSMEVQYAPSKTNGDETLNEPGIWHSPPFKKNDIWMRERLTNSEWGDPIRIVGEQGITGESGTFKVFFFTVTSHQSSTPTGITGDGSGIWNNAQYGIWHDAPPTVSTGQFLWMTSATLNVADKTLANSSQGFSDPIRITGEKGKDGDRMWAVYSVSNGGPWSYSFSTGHKWMRTATSAVMPGNNSSLWSTAMRIVGESGAGVSHVFQRSYDKPSTPTSTYSPPSGWSDAPPTSNSYMPLWMSKATVKPNGEVDGGWSEPVRITGEKGDKGDPGKSVEAKYSSDGYYWHYEYRTNDIWMKTQTPSGGWTNAIRIVGESGSPGKDGEYTDYQFAMTNNPDTEPTDGWSDSPPAGSSGYLWMRKAKSINGTTNNSIWSNPVRLTGPKGDKGDNGNPGQPGTPQYIHIKYAETNTSNHLKDEPDDDTKYMGVYSGSSSIAPSTYGSYTWTRIVDAGLFENLTVTKTFTMGVKGALQSSNWSDDSDKGYKLDTNSFTIKGGTIKGGTIKGGTILVGSTVINDNGLYSYNGGSSCSLASGSINFGQVSVVPDPYNTNSLWIESHAYIKFNGTNMVFCDNGQEYTLSQLASSGGVSTSDVKSLITAALSDNVSRTWVEERNYAKKTYVTQITNPLRDRVYQLERYVDAIDTSNIDLSEYLKTSELDSKINSLNKYATVSWVNGNGYATQSWVNGKGYLTSVPSSYATKSWVKTQISGLNETVVLTYEDAGILTTHTIEIENGLIKNWDTE